MEANTESQGACPGCHSCPQLLRETCCALWCQASSNRRHSLSGAWGDPDQVMQRSVKQQGPWIRVMYVSFNPLHWAPLHTLLWHQVIFAGPFQLNYSMLPTLKSATPKWYQTCPSRNSRRESQNIKYIQAEHPNVIDKHRIIPLSFVSQKPATPIIFENTTLWIFQSESPGLNQTIVHAFFELLGRNWWIWCTADQYAAFKLVCKRQREPLLAFREPNPGICTSIFCPLKVTIPKHLLHIS